MFKNNKPTEAIPLLEQEVTAGTADSSVYNCLGLSYYQTGDYKKAMTAFDAGLAASGADKRLLAYNAGNTAYGAADYSGADRYYSIALEADANFREALLNRANARVMDDHLQDALADYLKFEQIAPDSPRIDSVKKMAELLTAELKRREEEERRSTEQISAAEAAYQQQMPGNYTLDAEKVATEPLPTDKSSSGPVPEKIAAAELELPAEHAAAAENDAVPVEAADASAPVHTEQLPATVPAEKIGRMPDVPQSSAVPDTELSAPLPEDAEVKETVVPADVPVKELPVPDEVKNVAGE